MGQLILCRNPRAKTPFYIESGKVNIYSLEELMYFVQSARFVARDDFVRPEFVEWVDQALGLKELADMLQEKIAANVGLKDFFLPIEAANGYLTTSEIQVLNMQLQKYDHMSGLEAKKFYADQFIHQGKYVQAIHAYRRLLNDSDVISRQGHVAGDIWSNLGCAYAKMQDFAEAVGCFSRGFVLNHRIETLQEAVDAACLSGEQKLLDELAARFASNAAQIAAERTHMEQLLQQTLEMAEKNGVSDGQLSQWLTAYTEHSED